MNTVNKPLTLGLDWISPPGHSIEDAIEERGWTHSELATRLNLSLEFVDQLMRGEAILCADTAAALARVIGSTPRFWLRLEAIYRAALAKRKNRRIK